ncbi:MAG: hypothetical protein LKE28_02745 [Sphaerochaeta sp.]|nr:hypothetical protein [Sphaerochaeta sp.]
MEKNRLSPLGRKIFLDRYALKDVQKKTLKIGDLVVAVSNPKTGQREIGTLTARDDNDVTVKLNDGNVITVKLDDIDKPLEVRPEQMLDRVARGIASQEKQENRGAWEKEFRWLLDDWKFVPGGRILTGAGTDQNLTYFNCYVIPSPKDSRGGIINSLGQMTEIMSRGGGVGMNLSSLRPRHSYVKGVNGRSSGSVSWGALFSFVTGLIEQGGSRRGALMLILNVWHPDIVDFINSKREMGKITNANISVGITDDFMDAVKADKDWDLVFPDTSDPQYNELVGWRSDHVESPWEEGHHLSDGEGAGHLAEHHRKRLGVRRAGRVLHRPVQQDVQLLVLLPDPEHQPVRRAGASPVGRLQSGFDQSVQVRREQTGAVG